jgi:hypothetical protein
MTIGNGLMAIYWIGGRSISEIAPKLYGCIPKRRRKVRSVAQRIAWEQLGARHTWGDGHTRNCAVPHSLASHSEHGPHRWAIPHVLPGSSEARTLTMWGQGQNYHKFYLVFRFLA